MLAATAAARISTDAVEQTSVGAYAVTGNPCPASGWWRSHESCALDGTRWFAQTSLLPPATFAVPDRTFGKTSETPQVVQRRAIWQLVRLAEAGGSEVGVARVTDPFNNQPDDPDASAT
jgi:hypothetical protein